MEIKHQQYNDGVLSIYSVSNTGETGKKPKPAIRIRQPGIRYEEQTVGVTRFWTAFQNNAHINRVLRTPRIEAVLIDDIVIPNDGKQYQIKQVQYPKDVVPLSMDLSLERLEVAYDTVPADGQ